MTPKQIKNIIDALANANQFEIEGIIKVAGERLKCLSNDDKNSGESKNIDPKIINGQINKENFVKIYSAGTAGLLALCRDLGRTPVHKIGTTRQKDIRFRLLGLSRDHYGAFDPRRGVVRPGFGEYVHIPFALCSPDALPPSVRHHEGCFEVELPGTMTHSAFEAAFRRALRPLALAGWASSPEGLAQLEASGLSEADLPQATRLAGRAVRADEFYVIQPRRQAPLVLAAIVDALGS